LDEVVFDVLGLTAGEPRGRLDTPYPSCATIHPPNEVTMKKLCVIIIALAWWSWHAIALPKRKSPTTSKPGSTPKNTKIFGTERILFTNRAEKTPHGALSAPVAQSLSRRGSVQAREMGADSFDRLFPNGPDYGYLFVQELTLDGKRAKNTLSTT
jgi:hypothetical protein